MIKTSTKLKSFTTPKGGHYTKDGKEWKGSQHKMPNGSLQTGKTHTATSKNLYHYKNLPAAVRKKLNKQKDIKMADAAWLKALKAESKRLGIPFRELLVKAIPKTKKVPNKPKTMNASYGGMVSKKKQG